MSGRRKKDDGGGHGGEEAWLLPYADMITLLLGLFIVLFALSSVDAKKFDSISQAFSQTFRGSLLESPGGVTAGASGVLGASATSAKTQAAISIAQSAAAEATQAKFDAEREKLEDMAKSMDGQLEGKMQIREDERGLVLSVAGDALFESGSYEVRSPATEQMRAIAKHLKSFGAPLLIEGHTDGQPYGNRFGNQGLSNFRALAVYELFRSEGISDDRLETSGQGSSEPLVKPPYPKASMPANRRVEIHILAPAATASTFTPRAEREAKTKSLDERKPTIMESAIIDQQVGKAARGETSPSDAVSSPKPGSREESTEPKPWGGTSTPGDKPGDKPTVDIVAPIVNAS